jgi:hypothetical protein
MPEITPLPADYAPLLAEIKARVRHAQTRAVMAVNAELIRLYGEIGALIDQRQQQEGWGAKVIERLARDLHNELPEEKGFSERNIKRMLAFHRAYPHFVPQPVAQMGGKPEVPQAVALFPTDLLLALPWGHHSELLAKVKDAATRQWYMQAAVRFGWSRNILLMQIETSAHLRQGKATTNFSERLPPPASDMAQQSLKDPYIFDFLTLANGFHERELETGLPSIEQLDAGAGRPFRRRIAMSPHAYTEDQLVEQPAIGLCSHRVPLGKGRLHHSRLSPTDGWTCRALATSKAREERYD